MKEFEKLEALIRHVRNVHDNCILLGKKLMENGEFDLGKMLIVNGFEHDLSKFDGIEWDYLWDDNSDNETLALAVKTHNKSRRNRHHPECWGGIKKMPRVYLAELVCDWKARASEKGTSLHDWINGDAMERFGYTKTDEVYDQIMYFANILCDKPFKKLEK